MCSGEKETKTQASEHVAKQNKKWMMSEVTEMFFSRLSRCSQMQLPTGYNFLPPPNFGGKGVFWRRDWQAENVKLTGGPPGFLA
jgi:hypothetical protein